jgi:Putative adhesin
MTRIGMGIALISGAMLTSCGELGDFDRVKEDFHYSYPLQPGARLELDNRNGSIDIVGWDRNAMDVSGTKFASTADRLQQIKINVSVSGNNATISTEWPKESWHGSYGAKYMIRVPRQTALSRAQTTNGSVSVEDLEGGGHVTSTNGRISMARDTGDYDLHTTNGAIEIQECSGSERAHTTNGAVRGRLKAGIIDSQSTNGAIELTLMRPSDGQPIRASTTNGGIVVSLAEFHDNPITAETRNGGVTLRLPSDINAKINAETRLSSIGNNLTLSSTEENSKHRLSAQLGKGGPLISATTTTGSVHLERY